MDESEFLNLALFVFALSKLSQTVGQATEKLFYFCFSQLRGNSQRRRQHAADRRAKPQFISLVALLLYKSQVRTLTDNLVSLAKTPQSLYRQPLDKYYFKPSHCYEERETCCCESLQSLITPPRPGGRGSVMKLFQV